jgi:hypothetical protein
MWYEYRGQLDARISQFFGDAMPEIIAAVASSPEAEYLNGRWQVQSDYFEKKAKQNQVLYLRMRDMMLWCSWLTPIAIFFQTLPMFSGPGWNVVPLLLSTAAVGTYQWEESHNYGAQWSKFRLVAERLKNHRELYLRRAGPYRDLDDKLALRQLVEYCEGLIEGTDVNYFVLMVDPLRRNQT